MRNPKPPTKSKLGKKVSLQKIADELGTHRDRISWALNDDPRVDPDERQKIKDYAEQVGYVATHHPDQHHNNKLTQEIADTVVDGILNNKSLATIAADTQLTEATAFKLIRGVKVPKDYPATEDEWRQDVIGFMEIAIWKGTKRLAMGGIDEIDPRTLPVSVAILTDKLSVTKGQPSAIHASIAITATHKDLMKELGSKNRATIEVETNEEVMPDA